MSSQLEVMIGALSNPRGVFVTIEGIEGSGKSTLLSHLADRLRADGRKVLVTREPGGTAVGNAIRALFLQPDLEIGPLSEAFLIAAARAQHVAQVIRPALEEGAFVLCDRFVDSTLAYQGYGRGIDLVMLRDLCTIAAGGLTPDVTFVLDISPGASHERLASRGGEKDRMEREDDGFHQRVREGFLALAMGAPHYRVIDGSLAPDEVLDRAYRTLMDFV